jgi:hypothetical protein
MTGQQILDAVAEALRKLEHPDSCGWGEANDVEIAKYRRMATTAIDAFNAVRPTAAGLGNPQECRLGPQCLCNDPVAK